MVLRDAAQIIMQEIMDEMNSLRNSQKNFCKLLPRKEEVEASATVTLSQAVKGPQEECAMRRIDAADDLQLLCTKKCIPCHRCGSSMKFFMRRVKYLNTVKEYPAYRCMKKKCQTFRSPRTLARECNMLLRQGFGDGRFMNVAPTTNATRQLKEAFPDHFNKQELDGLSRFSNSFRDDYDAFSSNTILASSATNNVMREKEAWFALNNAKRLLDSLIYSGGPLSLRLHQMICEIYSMISHSPEFLKKEVMDPTSFGYNATLPVGTDGGHEINDERYNNSLSIKRPGATDLTSSAQNGGDSRSPFDTEMKSETSGVDTNIASMKLSSSTSPTTGAPSHPLSWINVSRHSPSFSVKMVDSNATRKAVDPENQTEVEQSTAPYETLSNFIGSSNNNIITSESAGTTYTTIPFLSNVFDQSSTSHNNYVATTNVAATYSSAAEPSSSGENLQKNGPVPIYVRPNELCFDDVADGGEILNEFFMPSIPLFSSVSCSSSMTTTTTTTRTSDNALPEMSEKVNSTESLIFAQLWNFNEQYKTKEESLSHSSSPSCEANSKCPYGATASAVYSTL